MPESNYTVKLIVTGPGGYNKEKASTQTTTLPPGNITPNPITIRSGPGDGYWPTATVEGSNTLTIRVDSSAGCDQNYSDNYISKTVYVSPSGTPPPYRAYKDIKLYYFDQYGSCLTIGNKKFTFEGMNTSATQYLLRISDSCGSGGSSDWYYTDRSYLTNANSLIFWSKALTKNGTNGRLWLIGGSGSNPDGFSEYGLTVYQGEDAVFETWRRYDEDEVYKGGSSDTSPYLLLGSSNVPPGSYSTTTSTVNVNTTGLANRTYRFAILSGNPTSSSSYYLAFGRFNVRPPTIPFIFQKLGKEMEGNSQREYL